MTAPRGAAARIARLQRSLSTLDMAALETLNRLRILTVDQLQRLHVADGSLATRARRTRALLRRLTDRGLAVPLPRSIGGRRAGSGQGTFCLSRLGQAVVASPALAPRRRMLWRTKPYFQDHMLATSELYVRLVECCRKQAVDLLTFDAEPTCWRRFGGIGAELVVLKPDAFLHASTGDYELASFIEVDLGTESLPTIRRKCLVYVAYWRSGLEQQRHGLFPRVVWLVPDQKRADGIDNVLQHLAPDARDLFRVGLLDAGPHLLTKTSADSAATGEAA